MKKFHVHMTVEAEDLTAEAVEEMLTEEIRHYGDFDYTIRVTEDVPPKKVPCSSCKKPVWDDNEHWVDDGPNRSGWGCP